MAVAESVLESVLVKLQTIAINSKNVFGGFCDKICIQLEAARSLLLVKFRTFILNGNDRVCDRVYFFVRIQAIPVNMKALLKMAVTESVLESVFAKASGLYQKFDWIC